jgi:lysozyme
MKKKKEGKLVYILILVLLVGFYVFNKYYLSKRPIVYPNFGIAIPAGYNTHGIDVSRYQKEVDWEQVSKMTDKGQKISFAIMKATEGTHLTDRYFKTNWNNISDYPLIRGAYLYFHPNKSGKAQASHFISTVDLQSGDLPPVVDIEEVNGTSKNNIKKSLQECLDELEKKFEKKPIIYASVSFYDQYLGEDFNVYPFWAAHYEKSTEPRTKRDWLIWQHNCRGRCNGIDAEVDFNVVNGSIFTLRDICL